MLGKPKPQWKTETVYTSRVWSKQAKFHLPKRCDQLTQISRRRRRRWWRTVFGKRCVCVINVCFVGLLDCFNVVALRLRCVWFRFRFQLQMLLLLLCLKCCLSCFSNCCCCCCCCWRWFSSFATTTTQKKVIALLLLLLQFDDDERNFSSHFTHFIFLCWRQFSFLLLLLLLLLLLVLLWVGRKWKSN